MTQTAAVLGCALLAALAAFQLALVLGAPWGRFAWGGRHEGALPGGLRVGSAVAILLYGLFAVVLLDRADLIDVLPDAVARVGAWVLLAYLGVGVIMNAISRSRAERLTMTPVTLALAVCVLVVALG